jgi:hypothetical protein
MHSVFWRMKEFAEGAIKQDNLQKVKEMREDMRGIIRGMQKLEVGFIVRTAMLHRFSRSVPSSNRVLRWMPLKFIRTT